MITEQPGLDELSRNCTIGDQLREATEAAALEAAPWIGLKDKIAADQAAVDAFHANLKNNRIFSVEVVMGEGDKDEAPMLAHGDILSFDGRVMDKHYDLAVDPIDGTTFVAENKLGAIAIAALATPGSFLKWSNVNYMNKLVVGPPAASLMEDGVVSIDRHPLENMKRVARQLGKPTSELVVAVLERPRNKRIIDSATALGAKVILLAGGDIVPALLTSYRTESQAIDMLYSSGGAPEAVLAAAGVAIQGGNMQAMWDPQTAEEMKRVANMKQLETIFGLDRLVGDGELHFAMTSITGYEGFMDGCTQSADGSWSLGTTIYLSRLAQGATTQSPSRRPEYATSLTA